MAAVECSSPIKRVQGIAVQHGLSVQLDYSSVYLSTINHPIGQEMAAAAIARARPDAEVYDDENPSMASEDFAFYAGESSRRLCLAWRRPGIGIWGSVCPKLRFQ